MLMSSLRLIVGLELFKLTPQPIVAETKEPVMDVVTRIPVH